MSAIELFFHLFLPHGEAYKQIFINFQPKFKRLILTLVYGQPFDELT